MKLPYLAIVAATVASWIFGALWYGAFGRTWAVGLGLLPADSAGAPRGKPPVFALIASFVAELVMAAMLAGLLVHLAGEAFGMKPALLSAFFIWLGFVAPTLATNYAYQRRPWAVWAIDGGHWLGVLLIQAAALALIA